MGAQSFHPVILLTRPEAQSRRFAEGLGARVVISALMAPVLGAEVVGGPWAAVILTSETGALAAAKSRAHLPGLAFCVGERTAIAARAAGFAVRVAEGDAEALVGMILSAGVGPLVHLRGREARGEVAKRLSAQGVPTEERVVYAQEAQALSDEAVAVLRGEGPVIVPLFSPRTAQILQAECRKIGAVAPIRVVAMSTAVAEAALGLGSVVAIAARPDGESMLVAVNAQLVAGQGA